jgi:hypothetical protein
MKWELDLVEPFRTVEGRTRTVRTLAEARDFIDDAVPRERSRTPHWQDARARLHRAAETQLNLDRVLATVAFEDALKAERWLP